MLYTGDFETTVDPNDCRVWAWGLCEIDNPDNIRIGNNLDTFFELLSLQSNKVYFHNLKFDGEFIMHWLFRHGFTWVESKKDLYAKSFCTLISDKGQWYSIVVCYKRAMKGSIFLTVYDSLKILPFKVETVAKAFKLSIRKGTLDYAAPRPVGHQLTQNETDYLRNDVSIMAQALKILFEQGLTAMTTGSNALKDYKKIVTPKQFEKMFPIPGYDPYIRESYRGGFTYLKPKYKNKTVRGGCVFDVNSLYPFIMYSKPLPFGEGLYFEGEYIPDPIYTVYVQTITCQFKIRKKYIPTIQIKRGVFNPIEYLESSGVDEVPMTMTNVDLNLFFDHYDVYNITYIDGWMFKAATGLFKQYINKWSAVKITAKIDGNSGMYVLAKLMLNSLYGKFALNPNVQSKYPVYNPETGEMQLKLNDPEIRKPIYIPVGTFITAYAREHTIRAAQALYPRFIYADTDSLHLKGQDIPECLDVDPARLGAWKNEMIFKKAHFIRAKTYIELGHDPDQPAKDELKITCAGLPESCHDQVTFNNFRLGARYTGKLKPRHVPGGIVLETTEYTVKDKGFMF